MAISTQGVTLKWGEDPASLSKKVDIKDFPALGGPRELLETSTLSDDAQAFIQGIQSLSAFEFTVNYTKADYEAVISDAGKDLYYALEFGRNGDEGVFEWQGQHDAWVNGAGVNEVVEMIISIAPSTKPTLKSV